MDVMVIGAGRHGSKVIYPSLDLAGINILAVATRHLESAKKAVNKYNDNGLVFDDYMKMLNEVNCDNVVVVLQADDAVHVVKECIRAKKNVFVEKPCGLSAEAALEINDLALKNNVKLHVGFMKRFADAYVKCKEIIVTKKYGEVCSFTSSFCVDATPFCPDDLSYVYFVAIHMLDLYRYLFGNVQIVSCIKNDCGMGTSYQCLFKNVDGVVGSVNFENRLAHTEESETLEVTFEKGRIRCINVETFEEHEAKSIENGFNKLSEKSIVYRVNYSPASGYERDLNLRGFVKEIKNFEIDATDYSKDNYYTNCLCDEMLKLLK